MTTTTDILIARQKTTTSAINTATAATYTATPVLKTRDCSFV